MDKKYILSHDIGTSGAKTVLMNIEGDIIASKSSSYKTYFKTVGYAEQKPDDWWQGIVKNTNVIMGKLSTTVKDNIVAIGVSGHMSGLVAVDKNGLPLISSIIHSDFRAIKENEYINTVIGEENLYRITGNIPDARSTLCKILWLKNNRLDIYDKTHKFLQSKDYINYRLTQNKFTSDYSDLSHGQLLDINSKTYSVDMLGKLGIDCGKLPDIHKSSDIVGTLCKQSADALGLPLGIPVVAGAGDGSCANVGAGIVSPGNTYLCLGTTAWIANISKKPIFDSKRRVFNIMTADGENYGIFGTMAAAGSCITWVRDLFELQDLRELNDLAQQTQKGANGLLFLPYLEGERSPIYDTNAKGTYMGLTPMHKKNHFLRSTMEGVAFGLKSILDAMPNKDDIKKLTAIGGGAKSELWIEILSDVLDVELLGANIKAEDATSIGAAIIAGVGVNIYKDYEQAIEIIKKKTIQKRPDKPSETYIEMYKIFLNAYPSLKEIFSKLNKIK